MHRLRTIALATTALVATAGGLSTPATDAGESPPLAGEPVEYDTVGILSSSGGINLQPGQVLRVRDGDDLSRLQGLLAAEGDERFAHDVVTLIDQVPSGRIVLVGIIDISCAPAATAGLVRRHDGHLAMHAPGHVPEPIECYVPVITVAALSVAADDAPPGSGDQAELIAFELLGYVQTPGASAVELTSSDEGIGEILPTGVEAPSLPARDEADRRFAFLLTGCRQETAELIVTPAFVDARLDRADPGEMIVCEVPEYYVAVFDVAGVAVLETAELIGSTVGP